MGRFGSRQKAEPEATAPVVQPTVEQPKPAEPSVVFVVAPGHGVGTIGRGILAPGMVAEDSDFPGGHGRVLALAGAGYLVRRGGSQ